MMNQIFSFSRFRRMFKYEVSENGKSYLLTFSLLAILLCMFTLPILGSNTFSEILLLLHFVGLCTVVIFGGSFFTIGAFGKYASPDTGIATLMIPASRLEKYTCILILNLLVTIPLLLLFFQLHYWTISVVNSKMDPSAAKYSPIPALMLQYAISLHIIIQGGMLLGSIYFPRLAYIKTAAILLLLSLAMGIISFTYGYYATDYPSKVIAFPLTNWRIWYYETGKSFYVDYPKTIQYLVYSFPILFLLATWYIAYVRLCEKEI